MNHPLLQAREALLAYALTLPGTREDTPWGERVAKVGKKVFVFFGKSPTDEPRLQFAVKLPRSGLAALDLGFTEPTGYGMGKHGWVTASFAEGDRPDLALAKAWVLESFRAIAPKKLVETLDGAAVGATKRPASAKRATTAKRPKPAQRPATAKRPKPGQRRKTAAKRVARKSVAKRPPAKRRVR
jgi:predicted DNA-binding protein (MmcQ/YjbR family)